MNIFSFSDSRLVDNTAAAGFLGLYNKNSISVWALF
jgi:hypothetical protein